MGQLYDSVSGKQRQDKQRKRKWPEWYASLRPFRTRSTWKAGIQLADTLIPYLLLWALMIWLVQQEHSLWWLLLLGPLAALLLVRIFVLFHDCVHGSLFPRKGANTVFGYLLGLLVFTPFEDWRYSHLRHHATYADLDSRGFGDIWTMTLSEYRQAPARKRLAYRLYRSPFVLLGLGAVFSFLLRFRLPAYKAKRKARWNVLITDLLIAEIIVAASLTLGLGTYVLIQLPVIWLAGALGIWLFYVQHQFEGVYWARSEEWDPLRASLACIRLKLWDEDRQQLVGFPA